MTAQTKVKFGRRSFLKATGALGAGAALEGSVAARLFAHNEAGVQAQEPSVKTIPGYCALCGLGTGCGIIATVKDGKLVGIDGMPQNPTSKGKNCPKAHATAQWVYSPDRLKYPMKRVGEKGEGKFERITWDEALDIIAAKLKEQKEKYGPETLGILSPARRSYSDFLQRFLIAHGSPNYGHSGICAMQKSFAQQYTLGVAPTADVARSKLFVLWGKQAVYSGGPRGNLKAILDARDKGMQMIAIKPSIESDGSLADIWVPVRPGTDAALALAMLYVVINEKLYDEEFVANWTYGFDKLVDHIQQYPPEWAEKITGVPAAQIIEVARLYATTKPASIDIGNGFEHAPACNDAVRAVAILIAITGNLDVPGGNVVGASSTMPSPRSVHLRERYTQEWIDKLVGPEFPRPFQPWIEGTSSAYFRMLESVLTEDPYPLRTIIAPGSQPSVSTRNSKRVIEALKKLDFYVVVDVSRTADMAYADVVIPIASSYECDHPFEAQNNWIMARQRIIEPLADYKSDYEFWIDLGVKMGYGEDFWNGSVEEMEKFRLEPLGITVEELRAQPYGIKYDMKPMEYRKYEQIFSRKTTRLDGAPYLPQGKVAIYNTTFEEAGFNPLPEWREPPESITGTPELLEKYPLLLSDYHTSKVYSASWLRNVPYLREVMRDPTLHINPATAAARGIADGDWVIVESPHGTMKVKAELYPGIAPDVVMMLHGWWQGCQELGLEDMPLTDGGANVNNMYSTDPEKAYDPLVTAMSSQTLVQVTKA